MDNILQTRILAHKISGKIVGRELLTRTISENISKGVILICAPAGYGKTSLIQEFLAMNSYKYSWLNIHPEMDNFYTFMTYLIYSVEKLKTGFGKASLLLIEDYRERYQLAINPKRIIEDITSTFLNELCLGFKEETIIVIDDLGSIENSDWIKLTFDKLFGSIPPNIHFMITTRTVPGFSVAVLNAKRNILRIDTNGLSFTAEETKKLVIEHYGLNFTETEIQELTEYLGGWITGLHLVLQSYGGSFQSMRLDKLIILDDMINYFTEDIFNDLNTEVQDFLLFTSILENFTSELCDKLLMIENSSIIINELLQKNIFIVSNNTQNSDSQLSFSYQKLFKSFLNMKLKETKSDSDICNFIKKASNYYSSISDFTHAINYSLLAKDYKQAVKMILLNFQDYFDRGFFETLWKWINELDNELISDDYRLLYYKSLLLKFYMGNLEESLSFLVSSIKLCKKGNDPEFLVKCCISKTRILISLGRILEAVKALNEGRKIKTDRLSNSKLLFLNAYIYYQDSEYDKSIELLNEAAEIIDEDIELFDIAIDLRMKIYNLYGHIFLIRGDYSKSISFYERVVKNSGKLIGKYETMCNLVLLYSQSGKFEKAISCLREAEKLIEGISIPILRITFLLAFQAMKYEFGDYEDSIKLLEEMNSIAAGLNHKYYIFLSYSLIGDSYYSLNKLDKAEEYYDIAFRYLNDNNELEKIQYSVSKALLLKKMDPITEIEQILLSAYDYYTEKKMTYNRIQISFHLADYYLKAENLQKSLHFLKEALTTSEEKEYNAYLQREMLDFRQLFDIAFANGIHRSYIRILQSSLLEKTDCKWISPESSKRLLENYDSIYDIILKLFGRSDLKVRGKTLPEADWSKKKWKLIFIYLMLSPKKELTKDRMIDIFYPETPADSADNIFHQIVSKFRNLVRISDENPGNTRLISKSKKRNNHSAKDTPESGIRTNLSLVNYEDKLLQINSDLLFSIDSDEFEKIHKYIPLELDHDRKIALLKKAMDLYQGDFMEGNYDTWCEELRSKYRSYFISMGEELIKLLFINEDHLGVINYSEYVLKFDKLNLVAQEHIIYSLVMLNKTQMAKVSLARFEKYYKKEYDEALPGHFVKKIERFLEDALIM